MFFIVSCVVLMMVDENADENASLHFLLENDPFLVRWGFWRRGGHLQQRLKQGGAERPQIWLEEDNKKI